MKKQDIEKLAHDYDHLALIKLTTWNAEAIDKLNDILNKLDGNIEYIYDEDEEPEPPYDWCISERMINDVTTVYYVYFNACYAGRAELADFLMDYDTELVDLVLEYDLEVFDYLIDYDFYDIDHRAADKKEAAADIVDDEEEVHHIDDNPLTNALSNLVVMPKSEHAKLHGEEKRIVNEDLTITRVWKNKAGEVTTALVNDVKIKPVPGRPFLWAGEDGYIYSELSFGNNGEKCRKGIVEYGGKGSRVRKLVIRYNDGINSSNPYGRIVYPAFEWETCDSHNLRVSRLVCSSYHGPAPFEGAVVDHIDGNKHNNRPDNLEWVTQAENLLRSAEAGRLLRGKDGRFVKQGECEDAVAAFTRGEADNHGRK